MGKNNLKMKRKLDVFEITMFVIVFLYVASIIFLLGFGFLISVKSPTDTEVMGNIFGLPSKKYGWHFEHYAEVFVNFAVQKQGKYIYIEEMLFNSLAYTITVTLFIIMTQVVVAYAVAKYTFKLRKVYYTVAILVMLIPIVGSLPSQMEFATSLHLKDSIIGVAIMKCCYPGLYFLVFYASFQGLSWTYAEAAQIDGAGHFQIFVKLMLPMVSSTILAVFILQFIVNWNDYYTPMLFIPQKTTIAYGLYMYQSLTGTGAGGSAPVYQQHHIAASFITCLPIFIMFIVFRDMIMGNVTMGGIKG